MVLSYTGQVIHICCLFSIAAFCLLAGLFLLTARGIPENRRKRLVFIEFFTTLLLASDAFAYIFRGNESRLGWYMVRISNFLVFECNFAGAFLYSCYFISFITPARLSLRTLQTPKEALAQNVPIRFFIIFYCCLLGMVLTIINLFTGAFYFFDESNIYHRSSFYPVSVVLGYLPGLISFTLLIQNKAQIRNEDFVSLLLYITLPLVGAVLILLVYGISWVNIAIGLAAVHVFFASLKKLVLQDTEQNNEELIFKTPTAGVQAIVKIKPISSKKIAYTHFWESFAIVSGGLLFVSIILSISGLSLPEKTIFWDLQPNGNDTSLPVCLTFGRNPEKHWVDEDDPDRIGAQYDGMIYNNMKSTVITDWSFHVGVPEQSSIDPGPWNGIFSLDSEQLNVQKPNKDDAENVHGADFYTVPPHKSLGFGCIMYAPCGYEPKDERITFKYKSLFKPLTNPVFVTGIIVIAVIFVISATITAVEGKLLRMEEENRKLEDTVRERTKELEDEKNRSQGLLLNILPAEIAVRLEMDKNARIADTVDHASVLFTDVVGFTKLTSSLDANTLVGALNALYSRIDERAQREGIEKIKTIGDSYMAASGLFGKTDAKQNALALIKFAKGMLEDLETFNKTNSFKLSMRIGINSGSLIAGVIGKTKFIYDIWGDTVNVASRMESTGKSNEIHVSEVTMNLTKDCITYSAPVEMEIKGKGLMKTYFVC